MQVWNAMPTYYGIHTVTALSCCMLFSCCGLVLVIQIPETSYIRFVYAGQILPSLQTTF